MFDAGFVAPKIGVSGLAGGASGDCSLSTPRATSFGDIDPRGDCASVESGLGGLMVMRGIDL